MLVGDSCRHGSVLAVTAIGVYHGLASRRRLAGRLGRADVALFSNLYGQVLFGRLSPSGVDRVWLLLLQSMVVFNHG